jgi:two-component system cell cycle sensor histidine kinase/response regulator CckA
MAATAIHSPARTTTRASRVPVTLLMAAAALIVLELLTWFGAGLYETWAIRLLRVAYVVCAAIAIALLYRKKEQSFDCAVSERTREQVLTAERCAQDAAALASELRDTEQRYKTAMEAARLGFWDWNIVTGEQVWSDTCKALMGLPLHAPANFEVLLNASHPDDRDLLRSTIQKAVDEKRDYSVEFRRLGDDGKVCWIAACGRAFYDEGGRPTRMTGIAMEIDSRKAAEERLRLQAAALEAAANAIVIADHRGDILWTNPAFTELTGYSRDEVVGKNPRLLKSGKQGKDFYRDLWGTITSGKIWRAELVNRRKDGELYAEEQTITPVISPGGEITHFVSIKQDISERKAAEESPRRAERNYRTIYEGAVVGIYRSTPDGQLLDANPACARICGYDSPQQFIAQMNDLAHDLWVDASKRQELNRLMEVYGTVNGFEYQIRRPDGKKIWLMQNSRVVKNDAGELLHYEGMVQDITERKLLEEQLRQSQRMDALGRLAGGVAHDFNNALAVIQGFSELLQSDMPEVAQQRHHVEEILKAAQRAASLTRQLLAFSRKQTIMPIVLDVNSVVTDVEKMLRRLIGEDVELTITRDPQLKSVRADRGQLEQVLMNLAVNARDAMPKGGRLLIETRNSVLDQSYFEDHGYGKPGEYCMLSVSDTGIGMDKETQAHIFEPFFTTKPLGKGTGLGLSTVYGIVKQSEGFISVYTEPGFGTTFRIYLPQVEAAPRQETPSVPLQAMPQGVGTILLVEDEEPLRRLAVSCLRSKGYEVLEACDGKSAREIAASFAGPIHLLLTDVIMPQMSGRELAGNLKESRPEMRVLYMSGYTHDLVTQHGVLESGAPLLEKPFGIEALLLKVRAALQGQLAPAS